MSKDKQIEEIKASINEACYIGRYENFKCKYFDSCSDCEASHLYAKGYRKQSEGEWKQVCGDLGWVEMECSACKYSDVFDDHKEFHKYCPNCGAKMKGEQ